jgi:hypothetical protein
MSGWYDKRHQASAGPAAEWAKHHPVPNLKVQPINDEARFGGVTGDVINVVTKRGTNGFHASEDTAWWAL